MERKLSKFAVGEKILSERKIKNWAIGFDLRLIDEIICVIKVNENGICYRTDRGCFHKEEDVFARADAKSVAIKFLAERMIAIAASEDKQ